MASNDALEFPPQRADADRLWTRGGFPDDFLARIDGASLHRQRACVRNYLERDVRLFGPRLPAEANGRLRSMPVHSRAGTLRSYALERLRGRLSDLPDHPDWAGQLSQLDLLEMVADVAPSTIIHLLGEPLEEERQHGEGDGPANRIVKQPNGEVELSPDTLPPNGSADAL
ncbi:MAG: hypothetical protein ACP5P4_14010 [Steroidobacteraceae bacterium]